VGGFVLGQHWVELDRPWVVLASSWVVVVEVLSFIMVEVAFIGVAFVLELVVVSVGSFHLSCIDLFDLLVSLVFVGC